MAANSFRGSAERLDFWRGQVDAWRADLERSERGGREPITVREFCRSRGLREPCFYFWRRELAKREPRAIFAPLTIRPPATVAAPIELEVAGITLRIPTNFDEATLARLITVLRA